MGLHMIFVRSCWFTHASTPNKLYREATADVFNYTRLKSSMVCAETGLLHTGSEKKNNHVPFKR